MQDRNIASRAAGLSSTATAPPPRCRRPRRAAAAASPSSLLVGWTSPSTSLSLSLASRRGRRVAGGGCAQVSSRAIGRRVVCASQHKHLQCLLRTYAQLGHDHAQRKMSASTCWWWPLLRSGGAVQPPRSAAGWRMAPPASHCSGVGAVLCVRPAEPTTKAIGHARHRVRACQVLSVVRH
jgi:hypothetical protein